MLSTTTVDAALVGMVFGVPPIRSMLASLWSSFSFLGTVCGVIVDVSGFDAVVEARLVVGVVAAGVVDGMFDLLTVDLSVGATSLLA